MSSPHRRKSGVPVPGTGGTVDKPKGEKEAASADDKNRVRYAQLYKQLKEAVPSGKKVSGILEELVCIDRYIDPSMAVVLQPLLLVDKHSVHEYLGFTFWKALTQGGALRVSDFNAVAKAAVCAAESTQPEVRRTGLLVVLMLHLVQQNTQTLALNLPDSFAPIIVTALKASLEGKRAEKRGFAAKTSWHEVKKVRHRAHLALLAAFSKFFVTHVFPTMAGRLHEATEIIINTAMEYSHKHKEVPVVRECYQCLVQIAEIDPDAVTGSVPYLPADMKQIHQTAPTKKEKDKKTKEKPALPCWDPLAAAGLVRLCLTVLHQLGRGAAIKSSFMRCLHLFAHYPHHLVFSEVMFGLLKRSGMYYVLLEPDEVYGSKELVLDYALNRVQNMLSGTDQVLCNAGLRLAAALCEQHLVNHFKGGEGGSGASLLKLEPSVEGCLQRLSSNPLLASSCLKAKVWLAAVALACKGPDATGAPGKARSLLKDIVVTVAGSPVNADHTLDLLKVLVRAAKLLPAAPAGCRHLLVPVFTATVSYLAQRCIHKASIHGFYSVLQEFLLSVDTNGGGEPQKAPLDIDSVPYQRSDGGTNTLQLVLGLLDGSVPPDVTEAEELVGDGAESDSQQQAGVVARRGRLLIEVVRFAGDFGNVMVNGGQSPTSNVLLLLARLQALLCTEPHHVVWEAGLAVLKIAARSVPAVRVRAYAVLTQAVETRRDIAVLLSPLVSTVGSLMHLLDAFSYARKTLASDSSDAVVDSDAVVLNFYEQHEKLKGRLSVYVRISELKRFKPLGPASEELLSRAAKLEERTAPKPVTGSTTAPGLITIDLLFA